MSYQIIKYVVEIILRAQAIKPLKIDYLYITRLSL
jgi:hypothetical protein